MEYKPIYEDHEQVPGWHVDYWRERAFKAETLCQELVSDNRKLDRRFNEAEVVVHSDIFGVWTMTGDDEAPVLRHPVTSTPTGEVSEAS